MVIWLGESTKFEGTLVRYFGWGNRSDAPGGITRGEGRSAAFRKLSKNPIKLRLVREISLCSDNRLPEKRKIVNAIYKISLYSENRFPEKRKIVNAI